MKRIRPAIFLFCLISVLLFLTSACSTSKESDQEENKKLTIVASLFPQYDFAREIAGEYADVTLLLPPGVESHSYDPTLADMIRISQADLFLYTGPYMEVWVEEMVKSIRREPVRIVDVSQGIQLIREEEHHPHEETEGGHHHELDPHIWTSPVLAQKMADNILAALCAADPAHQAVYQENAAAYRSRLQELDVSFRSLVQETERTEIFFGGRFALLYFCEEYGLTCHAAYDSCSSESEPSFAVMAEMIDEVREEGIAVIYYEELSEPRIARAICEDTGAQPLLLHSCHNLSKEEWENGCTYLSLMEQNLANLRRGLLT